MGLSGGATASRIKKRPRNPEDTPSISPYSLSDVRRSSASETRNNPKEPNNDEENNSERGAAPETSLGERRLPAIDRRGGSGCRKLRASAQRTRPPRQNPARAAD